MSTFTSRPTSTPDAGGATAVGAATLHEATSDTDIASYIELEGDAATLGFDPPDPGVINASIEMDVDRGTGLPATIEIISNGAEPVTWLTNVHWGSPISFSLQPGVVDAEAFDLDDPQISVRNKTGFTLPRIYEFFIYFGILDPATVDVLAPLGTVSETNLPEVRWSEELSEVGGGQTYYEVKVFDSATYGDFSGLDPDTDAPLETSGEVASRDTAHQLEGVLEDGAYRVYVRVAQTVNNELIWSDWDSSTFAIDVNLPGLPRLTATGRSDKGLVELDCGPVNALATSGAILTPGGGRFENSISGWSATTGATLTHNTTDAYSGSGSLQIDTAGLDGFEDAVSSTVTVAPGRSYRLTARIKAPIGTTLRVRLNELDGSAVELDHDSLSFDGTGTWLRVVLVHSVGSGVGMAIKIGTDAVAQSTQILADLVNLYDAADGQSNPSFETDLSGWSDSGSGTITRTRVGTEYKAGRFSQEVVTDGTSGSQGTRSDSSPLAPSQTHTVRAYIKGPAGAAMRLQLVERDSADSSNVGTSNTSFTCDGSWQLVEVLRAFGATGFFGRVIVATNSTPQAITFYVDDVIVTEGPAAPTDAVQIQRSDDAGVEWADIRTSVGGGQVAVSETPFDQEAVNGGIVRYRARAMVINSGNVYSDWVESETFWTSGLAYLKHPYRPWLSMAVRVHSLPTRTRESRATEFQPLGRNCAVFIYDNRGPGKGEVRFRVATEEDQYALDLLLDDLSPLLLQLPAGQHWPDRWLVLTGHERTRLLDKFDIEETYDSFSWTAVPTPDGNLIAFSQFDPELS